MTKTLTLLSVVLTLVFVTFNYQNCAKSTFGISDGGNAIVGDGITPDLDSDNDGLLDSKEDELGTDKNNPDTDKDGLKDGAEVNTHGTDPLDPDTDNGSVNDGDEVDNGTNPVDNPGDDVVVVPVPVNNDRDGDGLNNDDETNIHNTDPDKWDTDGDGLSDGREINDTKTDPNNPDTDGEGLRDGREVLTIGSDPLKPDTDGGGVNDNHEVIRGTTPTVGNAADDTPDKGFCRIVFNNDTSKKELVCECPYDGPKVTFSEYAEPLSSVLSGDFTISSIENGDNNTKSCQINEEAPVSCDESTKTPYDVALGDHKLVMNLNDTQDLMKCELNYDFQVTAEPIDGGWSEREDWLIKEPGFCGATCKKRVVYIRACDNPAPANGGADCVGDVEVTEDIDCNHGEDRCILPAKLVINNCDFGTTKYITGQKAQETCEIKNIGGAEALNFSYTVGPAPFSVVGGTCMNKTLLEANASCNVEVEFTSAVPGSFNASVVANYLSDSETPATATRNLIAAAEQGEVSPCDAKPREVNVRVGKCSNGRKKVTRTIKIPVRVEGQNICRWKTVKRERFVKCGPPLCKPPAQLVDGKCVLTPVCPPPGKIVDGKCELTPVCPSPGRIVNGKCELPPTCPAGQVYDPSQDKCVPVYTGTWTTTAAPACSTDCGQAATTKYGTVTCSNSNCDPATKPARPARVCAATSICPVACNEGEVVRNWTSFVNSGSCTTSGQKQTRYRIVKRKENNVCIDKRENDDKFIACKVCTKITDVLSKADQLEAVRRHSRIGYSNSVKAHEDANKFSSRPQGFADLTRRFERYTKCTTYGPGARVDYTRVCERVPLGDGGDPKHRTNYWCNRWEKATDGGDSTCQNYVQLEIRSPYGYHADNPGRNIAPRTGRGFWNIYDRSRKTKNPWDSNSARGCLSKHSAFRAK